MAHRHKHLCFTSQLWLPYPAFCFDPPGCFQGLCIWSGIVGSKSSKLQYVLQIMTPTLKGISRSWRRRGRWVREILEASILPADSGILNAPALMKWWYVFDMLQKA